MPIVITCPSCSTTLKAPDTAAGKKVKCPKCTSAISVPAAEAPALDEPDPVEEIEAPRASNLARRQKEVDAGLEGPPPDWQSNRTTVGILAIFLGAFGV